MTDGLLRQRRNLMIACALLWLLRYGGASFTKLSFAGFDLSFRRPDALITALWIAFFYFLYRYYQYFSSEGVSALSDTYQRVREEKCRPIIRSIVKSAFPNESTNSYSYSILKDWKWIYHGQLQENGTHGVEITNVPMPIRRWQLSRGIAMALVDVTLRNSVVTDYLLPFILAAFVLYYCGSYDWEGSFLRIVFS